MKVVYISNKPIYPLVDGGCVAMNQFLKCLLNSGLDVKHFTVSTYKHPYKEENYPEKLTPIIRTESAFIDTRINPFSALSYLFKKGSYNIDRFKSQRFHKLIKNYLVQQKVDIVIFESIYLANYFSLVKKYSTAKIIVRSHNVEFLIWERLAANESNLFKKFYFKKLAKDLRKVELNVLNKIDGIAYISNDDEKTLKRLGIQTNSITIPISIQPTELQADYNEKSFFFIGSMNWKPNIETVRHLINTIFPEIKKLIPDAKLYIAGSSMPEEFQSNEETGIEIVGFVDSISEFMVSKGIMLVPLKSGSGVKIKIIEGMNFGVPILTSPYGVEGIQIENGKDIMIASTDNEFIQAAIELYHSSELREYIGNNAKSNIQLNFTEAAISKKIVGFIKTIS
jgi:glycosyltransferase involved in cell wall biosynthesis